MLFLNLQVLVLIILQRSRLHYMGWTGVNNMATKTLSQKWIQSCCAIGSIIQSRYHGDMKKLSSKFNKQLGNWIIFSVITYTEKQTVLQTCQLNGATSWKYFNIFIQQHNSREQLEEVIYWRRWVSRTLEEGNSRE